MNHFPLSFSPLPPPPLPFLIKPFTQNFRRSRSWGLVCARKVAGEGFLNHAGILRFFWLSRCKVNFSSQVKSYGQCMELHWCYEDPRSFFRNHVEHNCSIVSDQFRINKAVKYEIWAVKFRYRANENHEDAFFRCITRSVKQCWKEEFRHWKILISSPLKMDFKWNMQILLLWSISGASLHEVILVNFCLKPRNIEKTQKMYNTKMHDKRPHACSSWCATFSAWPSLIPLPLHLIPRAL